MRSNSIGRKLTGSYILISLVTLVILETMFYFALANYYYSGVEQNLINHAEASAALYNKYAPGGTIADKKLFIYENMNIDENSLIEVYGVNKDYIINNLGNNKGHVELTSDYEKALNGEKGSWSGKLDNGEPIMSVSVPLLNGDKVIGTLRYISSLDEVERVMHSNLFAAIGFGFIILIFSGCIGFFMSNRILVPVKDLIRVTQEISAGNLNVSARKYYPDEIGQLSDVINSMTTEIKRSNQEKSDFISSISHELRTPLTSIKGWAETMEDAMDDQENIALGISIISRETNRLIMLVNDLLDFSKLQAYRIELNCERLNLVHFLNDIVEQFTVRFSQENVELKTDITDSDVVIYADHNRLKQVLINIIDNSLKFTRHRSNPYVLLGYYIMDNQVIIYIEDNGIGMTTPELQRVKEKFYKGNNKMSGTGLGLAIANEIISLHHGSFYIDSIRGVGTKVSVILPYFVGDEFDDYIEQFEATQQQMNEKGEILP